MFKIKKDKKTKRRLFTILLFRSLWGCLFYLAYDTVIQQFNQPSRFPLPNDITDIRLYPLKEYLLRGYVVNNRIAALEQHAVKQDAQIQELKSKVDFFVRSSLPPVEGIFYDGQIFDAYAHIISLIKQARQSIILIDNYINVDTLTMLSQRTANVSATIYTRQLSQQQQLDIRRHNQQYPPINICTTQHNHDRFLIIDDVVYLFGASLKDAGKKLFAYIKMQETSSQELINRIK